MASSTERLDLYKVDPKLDGNQTFNIDSMLNDNWDKLEEKVAIVNENGEVVNKDGTPAGGVQSVNAKKGNVTIDKDDVGLSNVDNVKQASEQEFNDHVNNTVVHTTPAEKDSWNEKETPQGAQEKVNTHADRRDNPHHVTSEQVTFRPDLSIDSPPEDFDNGVTVCLQSGTSGEPLVTYKSENPSSGRQNIFQTRPLTNPSTRTRYANYSSGSWLNWSSWRSDITNGNINWLDDLRDATSTQNDVGRGSYIYIISDPLDTISVDQYLASLALSRSGLGDPQSIALIIQLDRGAPHVDRQRVKVMTFPKGGTSATPWIPRETFVRYRTGSYGSNWSIWYSDGLQEMSSANTALGRGSTVSGTNTTAGIALGFNASVQGAYGTALGTRSNAGPGFSALALGRKTNAQAERSVAMGINSTSLNTGEGVLGGDTNDHTHSWFVPGELFVSGLKDFQIPHPHPEKKHTHVIRHGAVESPTAGDTLYRYTVEAVRDNETVKMLLPDYFQYLNKDVDVWVNGHMHFGRAFGIVEDGELKVTCETAGEYKVLVIGTRNDDHQSIQDWDIKGVEREIGESWTGETYVFEDDEIISDQEIIGGQ